MQAIILAAGAGKRFGGDIPKSLIEIAGEPILIRLIEQLRRLKIHDIVIVTGYQKHFVEEAVHSLEVKTVFNPFYSVSDNLASFWTGRGFINGTCIMAHGDLIVEDDLLKSLAKAKEDIILPYDRLSVDNESMKMKIIDENLVNLSKSISREETTGESIPMMKFSKPAVSELKRITETVLEKGQFGHFIDDAVFQLIQQRRFSTSFIDVTGLRWLEIDTQEDLMRARKIFERGK